MSVIEARALFQSRSSHALQSEPAVQVRQTKPMQIKQLIDALPHPTSLFDTASRTLYVNKRLVAMLKQDPNSQAVLDMLREAGRECAGRRSEYVMQTSTVAGRYRARASFLNFELIGAGETVLISVEALAESMPSTARLRTHHGLTEQESRVALLLAKRSTTEEIAEQLRISKNTVRRHIERVLAKLGVSTRTDVRDRLTSMHRSS